MLSKLIEAWGMRHRGRDAPVVRVDWHADLPEAEDAFLAGDWQGLAARVADAPPDDAFALLRALGERTPLDMPLPALPDTPAEMAVHGAVLVGWAWRHRGFGGADDVPEDAWEPFFETLDQAITALLPAVRADLDDGVSLGFLVRAATGAQREGLLEEAGDLFCAARRRPLEGAAWLLQGRGAKWGGSHAAMDAVVQRLAHDDDQHPGRVALEARALIERWLYDGRMADDPATNFRGQALFALQATGDHVERLSENYERLMSVWTDDPDPHAERFAHNQIGMAAVLAKRWATAQRHVAAIGQEPSQWPWVYEFGEVETAWPALRRRVARTWLREGRAER